MPFFSSIGFEEAPVKKLNKIHCQKDTVTQKCAKHFLNECLQAGEVATETVFSRNWYLEILL